MPVCPACGVATAPGPACGGCGQPLPAEAAASPAWSTARGVGAALLAVGIFIALSGFLLIGVLAWDPTGMGPLFGLGVVAAGTVGIVAGSALLLRKPWGWNLAVGLVAFGLLYAVLGLARGYASGLIGLAVWGGLGWFLWQDDVRALASGGGG